MSSKRKFPGRPAGCRTLELFALGVVARDTGHEWKRRGTRDVLRGIAAKLGDEDGDYVTRWLAGTRVLPDAHRVDEEGGVLHFLEIEDTSPLTVEKLDRYGDLWQALDASDTYTFELWVADRYGHHVTQVDLFAWEYHRHQEKATA